MRCPVRFLCIALALALGACSGIPLHEREQALQQQYVDYAGAPIERFNYLGRFNSWTALSDSQLVVWPTINEAYLLTVRQPCINLQFAQRIGVSSTVGTVSTGLDYVLVEHQRCQIKEIRPVDYKRLMDDRRKAAAAAKAAKQAPQ
jgi:hypothetical protein